MYFLANIASCTVFILNAKCSLKTCRFVGCVGVYIYMHIHVCIYICIYMCIYVCVCVCVCMYAHTHICIPRVLFSSLFYFSLAI